MTTNNIRFLQKNTVVAQEPGETVLATALRVGIEFPHSCQSGRCGACKAILIKGEVEHQTPYSRYALPSEEAERGSILACRAVPRTDIEVVWTQSDHLVKRVTGLVNEVDHVTRDIVRVLIKPEGGEDFPFKPGQYAALRFGGCGPQHFSMAGLPTDPELEFHIKLREGGCSSVYANRALSTGAVVEITGPFGDAYVRPTHAGPVIAIGGGSGLAPMLSITRFLMTRVSENPITLYHGVRTVHDLYLTAGLRRLAEIHPNFRYVPVLSDAPASETARKGLVSDVLIHDGVSANSRLYVAGPPPMVDAVKSVAAAAGIAQDYVHADPFY